MQRLRITWQLLAWSGSQDYCPAASLGDAVLTGLMRRAALSMLVVSKADPHKKTGM